MSDKLIIAIDGTAASGKGTLAKQIAHELGFSHLDSGKLYRFIGHNMVVKGLDFNNKMAAIEIAAEITGTLKPEDLGDPALMSDSAGKAASNIAVIADVRECLLEYQRTFAYNPPEGAKGAVIDGRDIGTVVCPDADIKFYVDADIKIRAQRRHKDLQSQGISVTYDAVLADMHERDQRDASRETAPMKPAEDSILLDTSEMSIDQVREKALSIISEALSG